MRLAIRPELGDIEYSNMRTDNSQIESAFSTASKTLFGKPLGSIDDYSGWLARNTCIPEEVPSVISGRAVQSARWPDNARTPTNRIVTHEEGVLLGRIKKLNSDAAESITIGNAHEYIGDMVYFPTEMLSGNNQNIMACQWTEESIGCYKAIYCVNSKCCAYSFWPRTSQYCFGTGILFDSQFCFKGYDSIKLQRCFELDSSRSCADSYYLHNCENVSSSIMCFNAKNLSYAVGNTVVGPEKFKRTRTLLLEWIAGELEKKKEVPLSIYNMGCGNQR